MNYKSILTLFLFYSVSQECFSQSKKVQIANLNFQLDSLSQEIESRNVKIKSNNTLLSEHQYRLRFTEKKLSELQNLVMNLEGKLDSLKISNREITQLKIELNTAKEKYDALLISLAECNDKFASINFLENPPIQTDTVALEKLANSLITKPCPDGNMMFEENSCTTEFPIKQYFTLGSKTFLISMVNFSHAGFRISSGKSVILLFQVEDSKLKLLDNLSFDDCNSYGQGLFYKKDKYLIGEKSIALHLIGGTGGPGLRLDFDYFIAFLNNKLYLVYNDAGWGAIDGKEWSSEYSFIPSSNEIFNMKISYEENKTIKGKPDKKSVKNIIYSFSHQEKKYKKIVK
jgi:hypothetical protein